jgi:hypothetical protein
MARPEDENLLHADVIFGWFIGITQFAKRFKFLALYDQTKRDLSDVIQQAEMSVMYHYSSI